jgi:phosphatidylglycerol:prolipoprotein diacylglycerol transferase
MIFNAIDPVAFYVFGWPIRWYAIFITSALIICLLSACFEAKRRKISTDFILEVFLWCVPLAVVFARIFYVLSHPESYFPITNTEDFKELFAINHGGITIIGAIFGAILGAFIVTRIHKLNFLELLDFGFPFMLLGQALGRWGNFINQEAYGKVVTSAFYERFPLGVYIDYTESWHYATFFYEMVLNLIGFAVLYLISRRSEKRGVLTVLYFIWYGIVRGLMEFIREDAVVFGGVYITQVGCFIASALGLIFLILINKGVINFGMSRHLQPLTDNAAKGEEKPDTEEKKEEK